MTQSEAAAGTAHLDGEEAPLALLPAACAPSQCAIKAVTSANRALHCGHCSGPSPPGEFLPVELEPLAVAVSSPPRIRLAAVSRNTSAAGVGFGLPGPLVGNATVGFTLAPGLAPAIGAEARAAAAAAAAFPAAVLAAGGAAGAGLGVGPRKLSLELGPPPPSTSRPKRFIVEFCAFAAATRATQS